MFKICADDGVDFPDSQRVTVWRDMLCFSAKSCYESPLSLLIFISFSLIVLI